MLFDLENLQVLCKKQQHLLVEFSTIQVKWACCCLGLQCLYEPRHDKTSEDWSDWADAQADVSLRWAHTHFVGFVMLRLIWV